MTRIYKAKITCNGIPIRIIERELDIDTEVKAILVFECQYQVDDEEEFKQKSRYDITNAIHRSKIEEQLKVFLGNIIYKAFANHEIGKMNYRQIKECDVDIQNEIRDKVNKFYLLKYGLDIIQVEIVKIDLSYATKKEIEERIKIQQSILAVHDMETEMKILLPEFIDEEANKKNMPWTCSCGNINRSNFCPNCGAKRENEENKIILKL